MQKSIETLKDDVQKLLEKFQTNSYKFDLESTQKMNDWDKYGVIQKDIFDGSFLEISELRINDDKFSVLTDTGLILTKSIDKERKFFQRVLNVNSDELEQWVETQGYYDWIDDKPTVQIKKTNDEVTFSLYNGYHERLKEELFEQKSLNSKSYLADVIARNKGGYLVEINGIEAFLPGSLASANKIINFDSLIGKRINVMIEDYIANLDEIVVSNKKFLKYELPKRLGELELGDSKIGIITGTTKFGIFIEFDDIFTGLLHTSEMNPDVLYDFKERLYQPGMEMEVLIKEVTAKNSIILTTIPENIITFTYPKIKEKYEGQIVEGTVVSIRPELGVFVRLNLDERTDVTGLIFRSYSNRLSLNLNDLINVKIDFVDTEKENTRLIPV